MTYVIPIRDRTPAKMRKLTCIFLAAIVLTGCGNSGNNRKTTSEENMVENGKIGYADIEAQEHLVGAFGEQRELADEEMAMFRKATADDSDKYGYCWITIFKPLPGQGEPRVTAIDRE